MAVGNFIFFLLTALVAVNLIFAESEPPSQFGGEQQDAPNERFFGSSASCNYTKTPGATCLNCTTASLCLPNNVSVVHVCRWLLPHCNSGLCSFIPTANCSSSG